MTEPLAFLDPALTDTTPPCEWYQESPGGIEPFHCGNAADWMLLTTCRACADPTTQLVCDPHFRFINAGLSKTYCSACHRYNAGLSRSVERLR